MSERIWRWWRNLFPQRIVYAHWVGEDMCLHDAIRDADKVWPLHICDSLAIAPLIESAGAKRIIDLGSGGGLPGIPLACADPSLQVTLLDSTRKKIAALERIIAGINLPNVSTQ